MNNNIRQRFRMHFRKEVIFILWCMAIRTAVLAEQSWTKSEQTANVMLQTVLGESVIPIGDSYVTDCLMHCSSICMQEIHCSLYFIEHNNTCYCNRGLDKGLSSNETHTILYGTIEYSSEKPSQLGQASYPQDCLEHYEQGQRQDGIYVIQPVGGVKTITWCDMANGGWTVIQRRQDGSVNFLRNWTDYADGFGNKCGEYWLGLNSINLLTTEPTELHIYMESFGDVPPVSAKANYSSFSVGNSSTNYRLSVGGYSGDCEDSFSLHDGMQFTTIDVDNDISPLTNCAIQFHSGWWHESCHESNLNGLYIHGHHSAFAIGINWKHCWGYHYSLKKTEMKVRRH